MLDLCRLISSLTFSSFFLQHNLNHHSTHIDARGQQNQTKVSRNQIDVLLSRLMDINILSNMKSTAPSVTEPQPGHTDSTNQDVS